ncbi:MAG: hypothetical protein Q8L34_04895 [Candidatus Woesearchaeota archaeon]|nr:hypothetical protein [Candidatus Woesearchaeota archaeon]
MITKFEQVEDLFKEVEKFVERKVCIYVIGGAVLLEQNLKLVTKDIDLVVATKEDFMQVQKAFEKCGFKARIPGVEYKHMNLSQILEKGDYRIDLFEREVCGKFSLSENMIKRAREVISLKNMKVFLSANEDVFLLKCMTERDGDLLDCESLVVPGIDWKAILQELKSQIKKSGEDVWITWIGERFDLLEERNKIKIPIMNEINKLREQYFEKYEEELKNRKEKK